MSPTLLIERQQKSVESCDKRNARVPIVAAFPRERFGWITSRLAVCMLMVWILAGFACVPAAAQERSTDELHKLNESVDALIRKVSPSVVQILVTGYGTQESAERGNTGVVIGRQRAIGSGFVVDPTGYIITNAHVVSGAQVVQVVLSAENSGDNSIRSILSTRTNIVP